MLNQGVGWPGGSPPPQIDGMGRVGAPTKRASAGGTSGTHHTALEAHFDLKSGVSQCGQQSAHVQPRGMHRIADL